MMAELLLTRQDSLDTKVIENASGLDFIVLDELHTYRGRQGADVAILVRRLRNRCTPDKAPICIGTSATMASEGSDANRAQAVANVASRLFGASIGPESVIDESLERATDDRLKLDDVRGELAPVLTSALPTVLTDEVLRQHPLAVWTELAIGLEDGQQLKRKRPIPFGDAVDLLSGDSGVDVEICRNSLEGFLTRVSLPEKDRGGSGIGAFLAFKLHQFISGAGEIFTTLTEKPRNVLFEGQLEDPDAPGHRLYPTRFCRECGHEVHVVTRIDDAQGVLFVPRNIDDAPLNDQEGDAAGYLTPTGDGDADYAFTGDVETYPEDWREERNGVERLRANRKARAPQKISVAPDGRPHSTGKSFWFIPGKFGFCPCCLDQPHPSMRERTKLAGLSGEGRSSATTLLVSTALEWMNGHDSGVPKEKRKLLGFTDNRQDAALQAGHFNDFLFVSLLRGAILRAVLDAGADGMAEDEFGLRIVKALGFTASNKQARTHWMQDPEAGAVIREDAQRSLAKVLGHRLWTDLRRGWRYTNPSLSVLDLIDVAFIGLDDIAADTERLAAIRPEFGTLDVAARQQMLKLLLSAMLDGLAVGTEALDLTELDAVAQKSRNLLSAPWAIDAKETPRSRTALFLQAPGKDRVTLREEQTIVRAGHNSRIGRLINRKSVIGTKLGKADYLTVMTGLMELLASEGLVSRVDIEADLQGWRLAPSAVRIVPGEAIWKGAAQGNRYFHDLYNEIAADLKKGHSAFWGLEGREHTAQVSQRLREYREWRFRYEKEDQENLAKNVAELWMAGESEQFLPALFCSPTMELGVDISALNAVYLRNVPPTPANYAQRAGRAGRSGQAAVIVTYCAAQSPHDQYFFERRNEMVAGVVRPPALDITNEELVRSHLHAVRLAEAKLALSPDIPEILDLTETGYPLKPEVHDVIDRPELATAAHGPMKRVLDQILASVEGRKPAWMSEPDDFVTQVAQRAPQEFDRAFDRWRELYNSARTQLMEANARSEITGLSAADRRKIKAAQMQASDQIAILEQGKASNGSDFYSSDTDPPPDVVKPVRIVPIVRDHKNALLFRFIEPGSYAPETIVTVQHALMRGIEVVFQLEEGEVLGEPLPARDNRRAVLAYEATEGGAGVLSRLIGDPQALGAVAREALVLMHFEKVDEAIAAGDAKLLATHDGEACVRGCYRCLLSYFNQPDHELIDRTSDQVKQLLVDLARGQAMLASRSAPSGDGGGWEGVFKDAGIPSPDASAVAFSGQEMTFAWRSHFVAACVSSPTEATRQEAEAKGWTLFELPEAVTAGVPDAMLSMFGE